MCLGICGDLLLRSLNSVVAGLTKTSTLVAGAGAILFTAARPPFPPELGNLPGGSAGRCGKAPFPFIHTPEPGA